MRKRYLSFLLSLIIFLTSFTPAFADSVEVLEPVMNGVESNEEKDNHSSDSVFILNSRDNNGKAIENKEGKSNSISMSNIILEERKEESFNTKANKTSNSEYKEIKPIEEAKPVEKNNKSAEPKKEENIKKETSSVNKEKKSSAENIIKNPIIEKNDPIVSKNKGDAKNNSKIFSANRTSLFDEITGKESLEFSDNILNSAVTGANVTKPTGGWETYEIGNGWTLGDFQYNDNTVTGFSGSGEKKVKTNKNLVVPSVVPDNNIKEFDKLKPVTAIREHAFRDNQLTSVVIPGGVVTIGNYAFLSNQLTSVVISEGVTTIGDAAFYKNQLTSVVIPESVTTIGNDAFSVNQLTSVVIPEGVTTIEKSAFSRNQLTSIVIPEGVTTIGDAAFYGNQLTNVVIPESVTTIGDSAFSKNQLTSVVIPKGVTKIGNDAFYGNQLTNVVIPGGVTTIGEGVFSRNQLTSVVIPDSVTTIGSFAFNKNKLTSLVIPEGVATIKKATFQNNQLTNVIIPEGVTSIEGWAFYNNQLISIVMPEGITSIGEWTFGQNKLTELKIPSSLNEIGQKAFWGNPGIDENHNVALYTPDKTNPNGLKDENTKNNGGVFLNKESTEKFNVKDYPGGHKINPIDWFKHEIGKGWVLGDFTYEGNTVTGFSKQGKEKVKTNKDLVLPSVVPDNNIQKFDELKPVTTIGDRAFDDEDLTSVVVSKNVTFIGMSSFYNNKLNSVVFPEGLLNIGDAAFNNNLLTEVVLPSAVNSIGIGAFASNKIKKVILPEELTSLGASAFAFNELTDITIPKNLKTIDAGAFYYNKISSVKFLGNVEKIVSSAFAENQLTVLNIPDSVKEIDEESFANNLGANNEKQVILYTESKNNPNNLSDSKYHKVDPRVNINVFKTDNEGNPIEGVKFAIFKGNKIVYGPVKTNKDGIAVFEKVLIDINETEDLILKETSTIKGYQLDKQETVLDLKNADKQIDIFLEGYKTQLDLPDTGTLNELPFIGTAILLLALSIFLRKKKVSIK